MNIGGSSAVLYRRQLLAQMFCRSLTEEAAALRWKHIIGDRRQSQFREAAPLSNALLEADDRSVG